ncbi:MAG: DUF4230 domain-containing protein [Bacteroidetes bacterium]|nr:MAG: DUF4230 domain-containing protein [Bacteroidota bacterium]TAG85918.1 MAG: DUF4230 domain-containing protein [Bacteroidota bacterium]
MRSVTSFIILLALLVLAYILYMINGFGFASWGKPQIIHNHNIVLEKIEQLGKLELVKYKFRDIYDYTEKGYLANETVGIIVSGEAVGCIDLKKIKSKDIFAKGNDSLLITLPKPELCYWKINQQETRIYNSFHIRMNSASLYGKAYREAEKFIEQTARKSDIFDRTKESAEKLLKPLLQEIAQKKIVFLYEK